MANTTDQYMDFDPTQSTSSGCCGEKFYDYEVQMWRVRHSVSPQTKDCSQIQAQLDEANATIADLNRLLEQKSVALNDANTTISELRQQLSTQPTVCEILAQHLVPIKRLNGDTIYYGLKNADGCPDLSTVSATSLDGSHIADVVPNTGHHGSPEPAYHETGIDDPPL